MDEVTQLHNEFKEDYKSAPMWGGYNKRLGRKIEGRQAVLAAYIDNLQIVSVGQPKEVKDRIKAIMTDLASI
jgi:hypothetical protein